MKKQTKSMSDMPLEYDFSKGVRGKYVKAYAAGTNIICLEPDVAQIFPNSVTVNQTLRALAGIIRTVPKQLSGGKANLRG